MGITATLKAYSQTLQQLYKFRRTEQRFDPVCELFVILDRPVAYQGGCKVMPTWVTFRLGRGGCRVIGRQLAR